MNYYWHLKNPDPGMSQFAKLRIEVYIKKFEELIEKASKGAYQSKFEQDTLDSSDQRLDFMLNVWKQARNLAEFKIQELLKEVDVRRSLETGLPDR